MNETTLWTIVGTAFAGLLSAVAALLRSKAKSKGTHVPNPPQQREHTGQHILGARTPEYPHGMVHYTPDQAAAVSVIELQRIGQYLESIHSMLVEQQRHTSRERLDQAERSQAHEATNEILMRIHHDVQTLKTTRIPPPLPSARLKGKMR